MSRLDDLRQKVTEAYTSKNPNREDWADWLYASHIFIVAENAAQLAKQYDANSDLAAAAGMLHDIADSEMSRFDPDHEKRSLEIAGQFLSESGYSGEEVEVIENAIRYHGCHGNERPSSVEGLAMAAGDALAHLETDFYTHAYEDKIKNESSKDIRKWGLAKIERDFTNKIAWDDVRNEAKGSYDKWKDFFLKLS